MTLTEIDEGSVGSDRAPAPLKALYILPGTDYVGSFESALRETLARGHEVLAAFEHQSGGLPPDSTRSLDELRERYAGFDYLQMPPRRGLWRIPAAAIRRSLDFLRYLEPEYADADRPRERAREQAPRALRVLLLLPPFRWPAGQRPLGWLLRRLEAGMPIPRPVRSSVVEQAPDVVLVSPLVELGSGQGEYVRVAEAARIPSVLVVVGPDDLTSKGAIRDVPTMTVVRDETQAGEAVRLHGLPREKIKAVAAHPSSNGLAVPAAPGTVEAIERAAPVDVIPRRQGRLLRPLLWLLTPLLALLMPFLRPRATLRAAFKALRKLVGRTRKRAKALRRTIRHKRAERRKARASAKKKKMMARDDGRQQKLARAEAKQQKLELLTTAAEPEKPVTEAASEQEEPRDSVAETGEQDQAGRDASKETEKTRG